MIGWWLFFTVVVLIVGYLEESEAALSNIFGWPCPRPNWTVVWTLLIVLWILIVEVKLKIL